MPDGAGPTESQSGEECSNEIAAIDLTPIGPETERLSVRNMLYDVTHRMSPGSIIS